MASQTKKELELTDIEFGAAIERVNEGLKMAAQHIAAHPTNEKARRLVLTINITPMKSKARKGTTSTGQMLCEVRHAAKILLPEDRGGLMTVKLGHRGNQSVFEFNPGTGDEKTEQTTLT